MNETIPSVEYFDDRVYKVKKNGQEVYIASVTTKLGIENKPFLYKYYAELGWDQARKKLHEAGERGKRIHYAWYIYLVKGAVIYNPWNKPTFTEEQIKEISDKHNGLISVLGEQSEMLAVWKLQRFFEITKPVIKDLEMNVYSIEDDIAGTLDNAFFFEKGKYDVSGAKGLTIEESGIYICDLKTGNVVSDSAWAQIAAYEKAYVAMGKEKPKGGMILHTSSPIKRGIEGFSCEIKTSEELKFHYNIYNHLSEVWKARNPNFGPVAFSFPAIIKQGEIYDSKKESV